MHEQTAHAQRVMVELIALIVGADVHVIEEYFPVLDVGVAVAQICLAGAQGLDLRTDQLHSRLIGLVDEVVVPRLAVLTGDPYALVFLSH